MSILGQINTFSVVKSTSSGVYLEADDLGEVLLPRRYVPKSLREGDEITVFVYLDSEDRPVATTETPAACVGQFAYLPVAGVSGVGAFLDWGLTKDVLAPFAEQHRPMEAGRSYLVYLYIDKHDGRIVASSKIDKFLSDNTPHDYRVGQQVELIIANTTELGLKAIINHSHWGLLHKSDVNQRLSFGQRCKGYIKHIRPDGKISLVLEAGQEVLDKNSTRVLDYLSGSNGYAALHDKSSPDEIQKALGISKSAFKKAIGNLYRDKIIDIEDEGIRLLKTPPPAPKPAASGIPDNVWGRRTESHKTDKTEEVKPASKANKKSLRVVEINREPVELFKILKFEGLSDSGGEAKAAIAEGLVKVNGQVELQKRKKIMSGDTIEMGGDAMQVRLISK
jgi:predicted RNA-binding protein (virulence factor B family)/ribosome-associated protein YbcJ (S4-like RNA binding protein)